jgi:integrase
VSGYCRWLVEMGILEANPCVDLVKAVENGSRDHVIGFPKKEKPTPYDGELGVIWRALVAAGDEQSVIVRLLILLLMRRSEVGNLRWSETDLDRALLTLPWHRTKQKASAKKKYDFVVPLPALAIELLRSLPRRPGRDLVFGNGNNGKGWQNWSALKHSIDRHVQPPIRPWRLHDIRRCGSTALAEYDLAAPHIREAILGHTVGGIAGVYCKAEYIEPRRLALERWCAFVLDAAAGKQPLQASNVLMMPQRQ